MSVVIITALFFDFTNGFHDSANAMATSVATRALTPKRAVLIAAVLNVVGAFLSTEVAKTISGGIVDDSLVTPTMIFAGLVGAILWNLATFFLYKMITKAEREPAAGWFRQAQTISASMVALAHGTSDGQR